MKTRIRRLRDTPFLALSITLTHVCLLGVVVYVADYLPRHEIREILKSWVPWSLRINLSLILVGILVCRRDIIETFKGLMNRKGAYLLILLLLALLAVSIVAPRTHRIFYDEDIYGNMAQNIALANRAGFCNYGTFEYGEYTAHWMSYNKQPGGWPFLVSLAFQLFGTDEAFAFFLNNLFFCAGLLVVFFIARHLTGDDYASWVSALALGLMPHNLIWSNTAAAEPSAALLAGVTVLCLIVYLKTGRDRHLFLLCLLIPMACQMRPESMLIFLWVVLAFLLLSPRTLISRKLWAFGILTILFLLPHFLHIHAMGGHSWGAEGEKFSSGFFWSNLRTNGLYYLDNRQFPVLLSALGVVGLFFSRNPWCKKLLVLFWFLLFWGIFLFFYAGSYAYGADVRFALPSFMPLALLAGMGAGFIKESFRGAESGRLARAAIIVVVLFSFVGFLPQVRRVGQEAWGARYDHRYAREFIEKIPERSIILTHNPTMFLLWGRNALQAYAGTEHPDLVGQLLEKYQGHVYFHYNYWCNTANEAQRGLCQAIRDRYGLVEIVKAREQDYEYGLYRMFAK